MTATDGQIAGLEKILDHGPNASRFNIVLMGDGYQEFELPKYAADVEAFVARFSSTAPYDQLWTAINLYRVDVVSTDSGAADPATCGDGSVGSGAAPRTYFDSTFCGDGAGIRRLLTCDQASASAVAKAQVPEVHLALVVVNTSEYGGSGGAVPTFSTHPDAAEIALHEMGHTVYGLADEYGTYAGCDSGEAGHDGYGSGGEPKQPNITASADPTSIKWRALLSSAAAPLPTMANPDCSSCDSRPNPEPDGYVGAYEGAGYYHCGLYRPQYDCRMRTLGQPFCAVCRQVISSTLAPFVPAPPAPAVARPAPS